MFSLHELLFTLGFSFLVFVILVIRNFSVTVAATSSSKNGTSTSTNGKKVYHVNDLASTTDQKNKEMMNKNEQVEQLDTYVNKSCYATPNLSEYEVDSMYFVEEVTKESDFQETENYITEKNGVANEGSESLDEGDHGGLLEEWEGIERTELEKIFGAAVVFVDSMKNVDGVLDSEVKMRLYGLHKVATEGPCSGRQPMPFKLSARAKWSSWHRLGDMNREKAMEQYVALLSDRVADWMIDKTDDSRHLCAQVSGRR